MSIKITKRHLPKSPYKRPKIRKKKTHITIHSTGNDRSTAKNEVDYLHSKSNKTYVSYHYAVGEDVIYEVIPPEEIAYHAGNRTGNYHSIGIEMVHTGNRQKVIENTIKLTKYLQRRFGISHQNVVRHHDWAMRTNGRVYHKNCPIILNRDGKWTGWVQFKTMLRSDNMMSKSEVQKIAREEIKKVEKNIKKEVEREIIMATSPSKIKPGLGLWATEHFINLNARGIKVDQKRFNDFMTRGEVMALLAKLTEPNTFVGVMEHAQKHAKK